MPSLTTITMGLVALATGVFAMPTASRNETTNLATRQDGNLWEIYWYLAGCDDNDDTAPVSSSFGPVGCEGGPQPGPTYRSVKVLTGGYKVNLHQNEVCSEPITTVTADGCYTAPADHFVVSFTVE